MPKGESPENLALIRRIDELFLKYPFYGSRQTVRHMQREGLRAVRHRVRRIFIERLWRSLKYEAVYLHELTDGFKAERVIAEWIGFYNTERPHSALDSQTPAEVHGAGRPVDMMDKPDGLPTSPPAQQPQQDVINRILAA